MDNENTSTWPSVGLGRWWFSVQFQRLIFLVLEERLRFFSGSASLHGNDSLPRSLIRLRSMENFRISRNFVLC